MLNLQLRILHLEDNPDDTELTESVLSEEGIEAELVRVDTRDDFLAALEQDQFDLIIADYKLPSFDGMSALELARSNRPDLPFILFSGTIGEEKAVEAIKGGATDYVLKARMSRLVPSMRRALRETVERTKRREAEDELLKANQHLQEANAQLERLTEVDPLTEVLNRRGLERNLSIEVNRAWRTGSGFVAVLIDCDKFKQINDTHSHAVGDAVLKEIALRLRKALRPADHIARVGGDEFLIILSETRFAEGREVAERLAAEISGPSIHIIGEPIKISISAAVVEVLTDVSSIEEILALAHSKLKDAKYFKTPSTEEDEQRASVRNQLTQILQEGQGLRVFHQPIFHLVNNREAACELLIRGPAGDPFEMPLDLFSACDQHELLTLADLCCFKSCVSAAARSDFKGRFHANIFPSTLLSTPTERLLGHFEKEGSALSQEDFCIEISEQQFIGDPIALQKPVRALKEAKISISVDDVGFGKSSIEALLFLEPDFVKIDRQWVKGIATDRGKLRSLERMVRVALTLDTTLIAEGIDDLNDIEALQEIGVLYGQGFHWGKPAPLAVD